ncbi:MAG: hypothetical protein KGS72_17850 [Cyanobacteria bacterium REEB67]|nr:hypothetical protein [Cyanobacteria bacterium REEB67]
MRRITVLDSAEKAKDFIATRLFTKTKAAHKSLAKLPATAKLSSPEGFAVQDFESSATIFRARLNGCFVSSLINGSRLEVDFTVQQGREKQAEVFRWLAKLTGQESAYWFYVRDSAGGEGSISWVKQARFETSGEPINSPFQAFETEPAVIGGGAYLGLLGASGNWLLLCSHYCEEEFEIAIHGSERVCRDLCRLLKCSGTGLDFDLSEAEESDSAL